MAGLFSSLHLKEFGMRIFRVVVCFLAIAGWAHAPKVFDCFPFFNEFEVLKIRLDELSDVVDYFVLIESVETQRGRTKSLYFEENKHFFSRYLDRIIHVALREMPVKKGVGRWWREHYQRNCIARALEGKCSSEDIVLVSDLDEIPRKNTMPTIRKKLDNGGGGRLLFGCINRCIDIDSIG